MAFQFWLFGVAAVVSVVRLLAARHSTAIAPAIDSREADAVHAVMNGAMALMPFAWVVAWSVPVLWALAAGLIAHSCAAAARMRGTRWRNTVGATGYHLLAVLAMLYAMSGSAHAAAMPGMVMPSATAFHGQNGITTALGVVFLFDAVVVLWAGLFAPQLVARSVAAAGSIESLREPSAFSRTTYLQAAFAHVTMGFGMAWILIG